MNYLSTTKCVRTTRKCTANDDTNNRYSDINHKHSGKLSVVVSAHAPLSHLERFRVSSADSTIHNRLRKRRISVLSDRATICDAVTDPEVFDVDLIMQYQTRAANKILYTNSMLKQSFISFMALFMVDIHAVDILKKQLLQSTFQSNMWLASGQIAYTYALKFVVFVLHSLILIRLTGHFYALAAVLLHSFRLDWY